MQLSSRALVGVCWCSGAHHQYKQCVHFFGEFSLCSCLVFALVTLLFRVYALWNRSMTALIICSTTFFLNVGSFLAILAYFYAIGKYAPAGSPFLGCLPTAIAHVNIYIVSGTSIAFETIVILLIVVRSYPIVRLRGVKSPLYTLIFEDGLVYYCAIALSQVVALVYGFKATLPMLFIVRWPFSQPVIGIACHRLLLHPQPLLRGDMPASFVSTTADITFVQRRRDQMETEL